MPVACWNPKEAFPVVLVCIPAFLKMPVLNVTHYYKVELMSPTRIKRDFGITTAITAVILLSVAADLSTQQLIITYFHMAIINLQQQIDLSDEENTNLSLFGKGQL